MVTEEIKRVKLRVENFMDDKEWAGLHDYYENRFHAKTLAHLYIIYEHVNTGGLSTLAELVELSSWAYLLLKGCLIKRTHEASEGSGSDMIYKISLPEDKAFFSDEQYEELTKQGVHSVSYHNVLPQSDRLFGLVQYATSSTVKRLDNLSSLFLELLDEYVEPSQANKDLKAIIEDAHNQLERADGDSLLAYIMCLFAERCAYISAEDNYYMRSREDFKALIHALNGPDGSRKSIFLPLGELYDSRLSEYRHFLTSNALLPIHLESVIALDYMPERGKRYAIVTFVKGDRTSDTVKLLDFASCDDLRDSAGNIIVSAVMEAIASDKPSEKIDITLEQMEKAGWTWRPDDYLRKQEYPLPVMELALKDIASLQTDVIQSSNKEYDYDCNRKERWYVAHNTCLSTHKYLFDFMADNDYDDDGPLDVDYDFFEALGYADNASKFVPLHEKGNIILIDREWKRTPAFLPGSCQFVVKIGENEWEQHFVINNEELYAFKVKRAGIHYGYLCMKLYELMEECKKKVNPKDIFHAFYETKMSFPASYDEQKRQFETFVNIMHIQEAGLEEVVNNLKTEYVNEVRMRKHDMAPYILQLFSTIRLMRRLLENLPEQDRTKMETYLDRCQKSTQSLSTLLNNLSSEEAFEKAETVDLNAYLSALVSGKDVEHNYSLEYGLNENVLRQFLPLNADDEFHAYVRIAPSSLKRIVNNILDNARKHGFTDAKREDYMITVSLGLSDDRRMFVATFTNNGNPLPLGMTKERFGLLGEKGGTTGGTGCGGNIIKKHTAHFGGKYDLSSENGLTNVRIYLPIYRKGYEKNQSALD